LHTMATSVCTPVKSYGIKSHAGLFSSKTAGGRMPLTPSPRTRTMAVNSSPFTPERQTSKDDSIRATKSTYGGNLSSHFAKAAKATHRDSPKSNIARNVQTPRRALELGVSDFALTGTGAKTPSSAKARKAPLRQKSTKTTIQYSGDRFIPNRTASSAIATVGSGKLDLGEKSRPKTSGSEGSSVLAAGAHAFDVGGRGSTDDAVAALEGLSLGDDEEPSTYSRPSPNTVAYLVVFLSTNASWPSSQLPQSPPSLSIFAPSITALSSRPTLLRPNSDAE
jgi:cell division cycle protein 20 (cofactor of APC complex)